MKAFIKTAFYWSMVSIAILSLFFIVELFYSISHILYMNLIILSLLLLVALKASDRKKKQRTVTIILAFIATTIAASGIRAFELSLVDSGDNLKAFKECSRKLQKSGESYESALAKCSRIY